MDTIRETIMKRVLAVMTTVTAANGYANTLVSVQRFRQGGQVLADVPYCLIHEGEDKATDGPDPLTTHHLEVKLEIGTRHDESADARSSEEICNSLRGDVVKAVQTNRKWTSAGQDYALDTSPITFSPIFVLRGQPDLTFFGEFTIHYRHRNTDPTALT